MKTKAVDWLKIILKFSFSFFILGYMIRSGRLDPSIVRKGFSDFPILFVCALLMFAGLCTSIYRWLLLLSVQGIFLTKKQVVRYGMIGAFFNTTMPGAVSGDLIKAWYLIADHKGQKKTPVLTSILLDRVMGVFGLIIVSASPIIFQWDLVWTIPTLRHLATIVLLLFAGVIFFFSYLSLAVWGPFAYFRKQMDVLDRFSVGKIFLQAYDAFVSYRKNPSLLFRAVLLSVFTHFFVVIVAILSAYSLGEGKLALYQYFLLVPIGLLTTAIPIAPAGLGVGHVAFAALFELAGSHQGAEVFTMIVTLQIIFNLTGIYFYLKSPKLHHNLELA